MRRSVVAVFLTLCCLSIVASGASFPYVSPRAIFGFTDSLSDVGNLQIAQPGKFPAGKAPYGKSIHKVTGRWSDGYLIIDFLAQHIGYDAETPSMAQSSDNPSFGSLCFGSAGTTVTQQTFPQANPDILPNQIEQFKDYKDAVLGRNPGASVDFANALYYVEIGGNDINYGFFPQGMSFDDVKGQIVPQVVQGLIDGIEDLYINGAVHFLIFNMPAAGCSPLYLTNFKDSDVSYDEFGCVAEANNVVQYFNSQLYSAIKDLRKRHPRGNFIYFDFYKANIDLLKQADKYHISEPMKACCGKGGDYNCNGGPVGCGCGSADKVGCNNPSEYFSWDGVHYTQKFYQLISNSILARSYMDPPTDIVRPGDN